MTVDRIVVGNLSRLFAKDIVKFVLNSRDAPLEFCEALAPRTGDLWQIAAEKQQCHQHQHEHFSWTDAEHFRCTPLVMLKRLDIEITGVKIIPDVPRCGDWDRPRRRHSSPF